MSDLNIVRQHLESLRKDVEDLYDPIDNETTNNIVTLIITEQLEMLEDLNEHTETNYFIEKKMDFLKDCLQGIGLMNFFKRNL